MSTFNQFKMWSVNNSVTSNINFPSSRVYIGKPYLALYELYLLAAAAMKSTAFYTSQRSTYTPHKCTLSLWSILPALINHCCICTYAVVLHHLGHRLCQPWFSLLILDKYILHTIQLTQKIFKYINVNYDSIYTIVTYP